LRIGFDAIFGNLLFLKPLFFSICLFLCSLGFFISVISLCESLGCGMWDLSIGENVEELILVALASEDNEYQDRIIYLPLP